MSALPVEVVTSAGRRLAVREIDPGDMLDLIEAAGSAMNGASASSWLAYAEMVCSVTAIDGVPVQMPLSKDEVKALARRIGTDGIAALRPLFDAEDGGSAPDGLENAAKN
ncbi:hypothetical protein [Acidomonas methanolica]|uniref:Uncharacterized protein n=1 Tax=Acidomonas methanolica NBRC 104435 TaxID=1231351 RepID=A0A023D5Z5_ACIMT|nr:hypothetical protein [Acidomonas methanolica]MBU2654257.1 hypothetical protein [Acidomonas methanolica]MCQ9154075.1 hypothetical protein [Acidomonas methanolica]GAJ29196.1 hypothetical protein Amme_053_003 [Acidomonas methanolica NBRC 104435]GBQ51000.1 hypothetical protein AA0498_1350 [Acidomonas methanolica]GEK99326.1 hypothetical protein AME01nite_18250 [Acidomonas methanolica NBRC 104435]